MLFLHCFFFAVFYVFLWNGLINRSSIFIAEELDVCPCWNRKILHLPWTTKDVWNMLTIWSAVSFILVVLFRSRTCDNALENHGRDEERTFFIFMSTKAVWSSWQEREHHWFSHQRSNIFQPSNIFQDSTSSNALHMTLLHPPHPPFCKQQRNLQRSNVFQPSNIFQDSTSSNALHMTLLHPPPPHSTPPHLHTRTTFLV